MSEEFSVGVNILLQRMETHPEEFFEDQSRVDSIRTPKWHNVMISVMQVKFKESVRGDGNFFTEAEIDALFEGYSKIRRKAFDDYVMDKMLNPEQKLSSEADARAKKLSSQTQFGSLRVSTANNDINAYGLQGMYDVDTDQYILRGASASAAQAQAQHIAAHQEATAQLARGLMNAYPYDAQPQQQSMLSRINKRLGFK